MQESIAADTICSRHVEQSLHQECINLLHFLVFPSLRLQGLNKVKLEVAKYMAVLDILKK